MTTRLLVAGVALAAIVARPGIAHADPTKEQCVRANEDGQTLRQHDSLRPAREEFMTCMAQSCPEPVRQDCAERLAEIDRVQPPVVAETRAGRTQTLAGLGIASVGVASLLIGGVLGIVAKSTYDDAVHEDCAGDAKHCSAAGVSQVGVAHGQATASTVAMIGGGVLTAAGVGLWLTARREVEVVPVLGGATLSLGGTF